MVTRIHSNSFLRWAGSKKQLLPKLVPYWLASDQYRYVEPFAGSAALYFKILPQEALLSDLNPNLVNSLIVVRDHPRALFNRYSKFAVGKSHYYKIREKYNSASNDLDRAAMFIYLNRYCFNGLYRTNSSGGFNVPYGASKTGSLPDLVGILNFSKILRNTKIVTGDFYNTTKKNLRRGDFVYLDPPYAVSNKRIFRQYGPSTFGLEDLERLASLLKFIDSRNASFTVSYAACREAKMYFDGWNIKSVKTRRNVAGYSEHRRIATEFLVTNLDV